MAAPITTLRRAAHLLLTSRAAHLRRKLITRHGTVNRAQSSSRFLLEVGQKIRIEAGPDRCTSAVIDCLRHEQRRLP